MTENDRTRRPVIRRLIFVATGTRPLKSVETRNLKYDVLAPNHQEATDGGADCIFYRPGCPCGVPF